MKEHGDHPVGHDGEDEDGDVVGNGRDERFADRQCVGRQRWQRSPSRRNIGHGDGFVLFSPGRLSCAMRGFRCDAEAESGRRSAVAENETSE